MQGILRGLLVQLPALPEPELDLIEQFISNYEYGLAVEVLMDTIELDSLQLSEDQFVAVAEAGQLVQVGPAYRRWLLPTGRPRPRADP